MKDVLLLNASEEAIGVIDWFRAVRLLMTGKATKPYNYEHVYEIKTGSGTYELPCAIVLLKYVHIPYKDLTLTKRNLYMRDEMTCQYCGCKVSKPTIDHIIPRSRNGKNTWNNLVTCCKPCNSNKANRTPEEAGMKLIKQPGKPKYNILHIIATDKYDNKLWERWIQYK
jgi:hypothetical protein